MRDRARTIVQRVGTCPTHAHPQACQDCVPNTAGVSPEHRQLWPRSRNKVGRWDVHLKTQTYQLLLAPYHVRDQYPSSIHHQR